MHDRIERATGVLTSIALVAAAALLAPAFAGVAPSAALAAVALGVTVLAFVVREEVRALAPAPWLGLYFEAVWAGVAVATLVLVAFLDATAAELQTLGAVVGLIGLFNYLLRPVYFTLGSLLSRIARAV
ncbi:hypothetical protein [Halapricum desulfuricans]|uniref:Putative membrane protein n=1 Tax=Halapricum desulfuricans TaxID=2841257 RepID=A0A897P102_9EURY|nr:hypothetical protein [Halapricum desulfuricans]QSG15936.1 putative membrane protein [Halapricum desulfuricans]